MPRKSRPWFRWNRNHDAGRWYVTQKGKQIALPVTDPSDDAGAWAALKTLINRAVREGPVGPRHEPLADLVDVFLDSVKHRIQPSTLTRYKGLLDSLVEMVPDATAATIDAADLDRKASERGWTQNTRATFLVAVQGFVRWAGRKDFKVPMPPRESRGADAVIDADTYSRILAETRGDFRQFCRFLWATGARQQEAAGITGAMVDWASGTVRLKDHKGKGRGKARILYLSAEALAILREQADKHKEGFLFQGNRGRRMSRQSIILRFGRLSDAIGRKVFAHKFRHAYCTRALLSGVPSAIVAEMAGHTGTGMIERHYGHLGARADLLREAANKVA